MVINPMIRSVDIDTTVDIRCDWSITDTDINGSQYLDSVRADLIPYSYPMLTFQPPIKEVSVGIWTDVELVISNEGNDRGIFTIVNITAPDGVEYRLPEDSLVIDEKGKGYLNISIIQIRGWGRINEIEMEIMGTVGNDTEIYSSYMNLETKYTPVSFFLGWYFPMVLLILLGIICATPTFYRRTLGKNRLIDPIYS